MLHPCSKLVKASLFLSLQSVELNPSSLWEDEDSYQFYSRVTDIRPFVPAILFEGKKRGTSESSDTAPPGPPSADGGETKTEGDDKPEEEGENFTCRVTIRFIVSSQLQVLTGNICFAVTKFWVF